jgi:hypothetical protein
MLLTISSIESSPIAGNPFTRSCDEWREGTYEKFQEWSVRQFGVKELEDDDVLEAPVLIQKAKDISFEKNKRGIFILPPMTDFHTVRAKQRVIRGYIGAVYSK